MQRSRIRPFTLAAGCWMVALAAAQTTGPATGAADADALRRLVDQIARGDEVQAADATEMLTERVLAPLVDALGSLEARPLSEQFRIDQALSRLTAKLHIRLYRADLEPPDREALDRVLSRSPELALRLFSDDPETRLAALYQIPLEPGSGAGVLMAARVLDSNADVAAAALALARRVKDPALARGLIRFVAKANAILQSDLLTPAQSDVAIVLTDFSRQAIVALADLQAREAVPTILESLRHNGRGPYRSVFETGATLNALNRLADESSAPTLLEFLDDNEIFRTRPMGPAGVIVETVGDAALICLLRIYGFEPAALGMKEINAEADFAGFDDPAARRAAQRRFRDWYEANASKPKGDRAALGP